MIVLLFSYINLYSHETGLIAFYFDALSYPPRFDRRMDLLHPSFRLQRACFLLVFFLDLFFYSYKKSYIFIKVFGL